MTPEAVPPGCLACSFWCPGVCDVEPSRALHGARVSARGQAPADEELVKRHLTMSETSHESPHFTTLFERHFRFVVAAVCRITGRFDMAQDLAQEVFVKALLNVRSFRQDARVRTWLYAIARNCCYDYARARAVRPREVSDDTVADSPPVVGNDALQALYLAEARRIVLRLMRDADLDDIERRAFQLHYAGDVPIDAVTARLGLRNRSGAKAHIVSAKRKLRSAVRRWRSRTANQASITPWRMA